VLVDDNEKTCVVERALLPDDARQGDILRLVDGQYEADRDETARRRERIHRMEEMLRANKK
jgi:hypothetical protein